MAQAKKTPEEIDAARDALDAQFTGVERRETFNVARVGDDVLPESWDDALALMGSIGATISKASEELADEFPLIDKARLVNRECLFLTWSISSPENQTYETPYMVVRGITRDGKRFRFTDGSTGICNTLIRFTEQRIKAGAAVPNAGLHLETGLRVSEYEVEIPDPKTGELRKQPAKTFYIDNQPV